MLKKTINYTDFNGVEVTEDFYFNLSKAELTEMTLSQEGGLENYIKKIVDAKDTKEIASLFKTLILKSYGVKSADGKRFQKSEQLSTEFTQTPAYDILYMELATNEEAASAFIKGILPADLAAQVANQVN